MTFDRYNGIQDLMNRLRDASAAIVVFLFYAILNNPEARVPELRIAIFAFMISLLIAVRILYLFPVRSEIDDTLFSKEINRAIKYCGTSFIVGLACLGAVVLTL
ncbi:MAG: hypothetical protein AAGG79_01680 [Pseudomonadota bacterium]